ncbi:CvpA family protein [Loigolactobacillus jiayinensis]|uniref:CvpA family protein n=1 Tax=Loigolactobacillus jiayinensis TaxID=2486016 RepID=A0ABW1REL8_9LACO|nr:CvpA family protein [Loigolactobacillus jiayinensis]
MIVTIIIAVILIMAVYRGLKRGLIIQLLYTLGYIGVYIFARLTAPNVSAWLATWSGSAAASLGVTNTIAFLMMIALGWFIVRMLARWSRLITWLPVIKQVNGVAGAIVAFVLNYLGLFIVLTVLNFIPNTAVQNQISQSSAAQVIIDKTPVLTSQLLQKYLFNDENNDNSDSSSTATDESMSDQSGEVTATDTAAI